MWRSPCTIPPSYPHIVRNDPGAFERKTDYVSVDFEFDPRFPLRPTETGLSAGAAPHTFTHNFRITELLDRLDLEGVTWIGHNSLTTERKILEAELGRPVPLDRIEDTMILHYCANAHLCKGAAKDEDEEDPRGQGFMDLWSMASLYTDLPQWKRCRGGHCSGPCPLHDHDGYNGVDAYAVDIAYPRIRADLEAKKVSPAYINHIKEVVIICDKMRALGVNVDRELVRKLEREMFERKDAIFPSRMVQAFGKPTKKFPEGKPLKNLVQVWDAPFNPRAPEQVLQWFKDHGLTLDSAGKEDIHNALNDLREDDESLVAEWLQNLYDYKSEGKGLNPWFADQYFHEDGLMHPRFIGTGTSLGRLASSNPNFQNIPKRGFGKQVRRVVIPRDPGLIFAEADKSQLELRMCLWQAGMYELLPYDEDAFTWLVKTGNGLFERIAETVNNGMGARDHSKSVSHGADYGEGIRIYYPKDLNSGYIKKLIASGALVIYKDWEFMGGVVGFTGINLAKRLFGEATEENRRKALEIQEAYFARFGAIRNWQKRVSRQAELGYIRGADGSYVELFGSPEDRLKIAFAKHGQGGGATDVQEAMRRYDKEGYTPLIQVHDSLLFEFPIDVTDNYLKDFFSIMTMESKFMPGFRGPVEIKKGRNWLDMEKVAKI